MTDAILIVGGGVAGLTAAQHCVAAGARAIVVENGAILGGRLAAAMTGKSAPGNSIGGVPIPALDALAQAENTEFLTLAGLDEIRGRPGNFEIAIVERARFVTDACTRCNRCRAVCPVVIPNEYDAGLSYRKAIDTPLHEALPEAYVIDIDSCLNAPPNYLPCNRCMEVCDDDAIDFGLPLDKRHERQVGAIVVAVGYGAADGQRLRDCGYGIHADVVTAAELDRLMIAPGPTGGYAVKPSNEETPDRVLMILDEQTPFCMSTTARQIEQLAAQEIQNIELLITTQAPAGERSDILHALPGIASVHWGLLQKVAAGTGNRVSVTYADFADNRVPTNDYDLVVLNTAVAPAAGLDVLAAVLGCDLSADGYIARPSPGQPCATSRPGVYVAGSAGGPANLCDSIDEATVAAAAALNHLDPRLLRPDPARQLARDPDPETGQIPEQDLRARIERALNEMIRRGD